MKKLPAVLLAKALRLGPVSAMGGPEAPIDPMDAERDIADAAAGLRHRPGSYMCGNHNGTGRPWQSARFPSFAACPTFARCGRDLGRNGAARSR